MSKSIIMAVAFILITLQLFADNYYVTPEGSGNKDGSSWTDAIQGSDIQYYINQIMKPGDKLLLDDDGGFFDDIQIQIKNGGNNKTNRIFIEGVDKGDGYPKFKGPGREDGVFIYLEASVSYVTIRNLIAEDYKYVIESEEAINAPNEYILIDGLDINNVTDGLYLRDFRNSIIKNCTVTYHAKRGVRLRTGCRDIEILDCYTDHNLRDYGFPSNQFPVGFEVGVGRHDEDSLDQTNITFIRCEARNCVDDDQSYWNGDGFLVNDKHYDIRFYNCIAYGNADGGWDDKGIGTYYENCIAVGNGRNFRNWHSGTYVNCLAANPAKYADGASGGHDNWWLDGKWGDAVVEMYHCTSHNGAISSSEHVVKLNVAENCIFSESSDDSRVETGSNNVFTNADEPNYKNPADDYDGHPLDAYNSQEYGPGQGYWYTEGEKPVVSDLNVTPDSGDTPLIVNFNVSATDPDGADSLLTYSWILNDGEISNENQFQHTFDIPGNYSMIVKVKDEDFLSTSDTITVNVTGNYPPEVYFTLPYHQQVFFVNQSIDIKVDAGDRDGTVDSVLFYRDNNYLVTDTSSPYEHTIPGLSEGKYIIQARAYDDDTVYVEDSVKVEVVVPITLTEISWDGYVDLNWEDHIKSSNLSEFGELAGYNVYRSTEAGSSYTKINSSLADTAFYKDVTVNNGTKYYYKVTAENSEGNETSFSNEVAAMPQVFVSIGSIDDAHVRDGKYSDENYGTEESLLIKTEGEDWKRFSYIKFDLSSVGSLSSASLRVKSTDVQAIFHSVKCYLAANDSWTEQEITWNSKPDTSSLIDITKVPGSQAWVEFDVTDEVKAELSNDDTVSLVLVKIEQGNPGYSFHSGEAAESNDRPMLSVFPEDTTSYTLSAGAGEGGLIDPEGDIDVFKGYNQTFTIKPDKGYKTEDVLVDDASQGAVSNYTFMDVTDDHTISATFTQLSEYTITPSAGKGGSITPNGDTTVYEGDSLSFTITPENDYEINDVLVDGTSVGAVDTYTFLNIAANHTIEVIFDEITGIDTRQRNEHVAIYPNPARSEFTVSPGNAIFDVEIYTPGGDCVKVIKNLKSKKTIKINELHGPGLYIIKVYNDDEVNIKKLIVQ